MYFSIITHLNCIFQGNNRYSSNSSQSKGITGGSHSQSLVDIAVMMEQGLLSEKIINPFAVHVAILSFCWETDAMILT